MFVNERGRRGVYGYLSENEARSVFIEFLYFLQDREEITICHVLHDNI